MNKLLVGLCALTVGIGVLGGCTERNDRISGDRNPTPSASPSMNPRTAAPSPVPPVPDSSSSTAPSATPSTPSTSPSEGSK